MRTVARTVRVLVAVAIAGVALIAGAAPCFACSCAATTTGAKLRDADEAFVGRVIETVTDGEGTTQTFEVDGVFEGELGPTVDVWAASGDTCAVFFPEAERRALVLTRSEGRWTTSVCSLVTEAALTRVAGPPRPPTEEAAPPPGSPVPSVTSSSDGGGAVARWSTPILGVLVGIAAIWLTLVLMSRRERRRSEGAASEDGGTDDDATILSSADDPGSAGGGGGVTRLPPGLG